MGALACDTCGGSTVPVYTCARCTETPASVRVRDLELVKDLERIARAPSQHPAWSIRDVLERAAAALLAKATGGAS